MKYWNPKLNNYVDRPDIDMFIKDVLEVCAKHGFSLSTGDYINSFEIRDYDPLEKDLEHATDNTTSG